MARMHRDSILKDSHQKRYFRRIQTLKSLNNLQKTIKKIKKTEIRATRTIDPDLNVLRKDQDRIKNREDLKFKVPKKKEQIKDLKKREKKKENNPQEMIKINNK